MNDSLPNTGYKKNDFTGFVNGFIYSKKQVVFAHNPNAATPVLATDEQAWLDAFKASNKNIRLFPVNKTFDQDHSDNESVFETGSNNMQMYLGQKAGLFKFLINEPSDYQISEFQKLNNKRVFVFFITNKGFIEGLQRNADGIGSFEFFGYECVISVQKTNAGKDPKSKKMVVTIQVQDPEEGLKHCKTIKPDWDVNRVEGVSDVVIRKIGVTATTLRVHVATAEDFIGVEGINETENMLALLKEDGSKTSIASSEIGDGEYQISFTDLANAEAGDKIGLIDLTDQTDFALEAVIAHTLVSEDLGGTFNPLDN